MSSDSKALRRYQASVERSLGLFDATHEWADYIAFLSRLHKALSTRPEGEADVPLKQTVAKHLAQCMNPSLPSGVHQKALEVYDLIFSTIGPKGLSRDLSLYFPGFAHTLAFASLSIRPLFLSLIELHVLKLSSWTLRPALKALLLSLLPGLEEETNEDFEATLAAVNKTRQIFSDDSAEGFFWQTLFLASITNIYRRTGVLVYLARHLPKFGSVLIPKPGEQSGPLPSTILSPEPGLLIRCFATGLQDDHILIQRGFLDLLVTHLPLNSTIFRGTILSDDLDILVTSAMYVVLRRDMSLNRRLWTWFLGPEANYAGADATSVSADGSSESTSFTGGNLREVQESAHMREFGLPPLIRCFRKIISNASIEAAERARPFRIGLSLMDRWEIGGPVVQATFIPLMQSLYDYQLIARSQEDYDELFRSANVFFDGVESQLIWSEVFRLVESQKFDLVEFIISHFNLQEEEMLSLHIPLNALAISETLTLQYSGSSSSTEPSTATETSVRLTQIMQTLVSLIPSRGLSNEAKSVLPNTSIDGSNERNEVVKKFYSDQSSASQVQSIPFSRGQVGQYVLENIVVYFIECLNGNTALLSDATQILTTLISKTPKLDVLESIGLVPRIHDFLKRHANTEATFAYLRNASIIAVLNSISTQESRRVIIQEKEVLALTVLLVKQLWPLLAPREAEYHVEVAQSLWDLHTISRNHHGVESALISSMIDPDASGLPSTGSQISEISLNRFSVLWNHIGTTVKTQSPSDALSLLKQPLLLTIDCLSDGRTEWLQSLPTLIPLYDVILHDVENRYGEMLTHLARLQKIIRFQSKDQWQQFVIVPPSPTESPETPLAIKVLDLCSEVIGGEKLELEVEQTALSMIRTIQGHLPTTTSGNDTLLNQIVEKLGQSSTPNEIQASLLETLTSLLGQRRPKPEILACVTKGMSKASPSLIDKWISTLCFLVPLYSEVIFQIVIKVTEAFCTRLETVFMDMSKIFSESPTKIARDIVTGSIAPESGHIASTNNVSLEKVMFNLLAGLEYVLARAHERLTDLERETYSSKSPDLPQGLFSNIIPGNPSSTDTTQIRSSLANDRLSVVLSFQDFIRICVKIWLWGSSSHAVAPLSRASFHYTSAKMRIRVRRILENLLEAEPQECLETIIELWVNAAKSQTPLDHELVLRLVQTLSGARPRIMMPATFNAIYNRTNPAALDKNQKSTMSTHVSALELLAFLIEYTKALEDDLLDELWADCTTFLREVLGNPMPHRQILLRLLEFVAVLCAKMENTNFGEETKTRRELGELCLRLFTAIFTVKPGGEDSNPIAAIANASQKANLAAPPYLGPGNSVQILSKVLPALGVILADSDRMTNAVSGIMTNITGPMLRSRTSSQASTPEFFSLLEFMSKTSGASKLWRRDVLDAFNDPKFFQTPIGVVKHWLPVIRYLLATEKQVMSEILTRLTAPTTAGIMFGVGATTARSEADKRTQLNLKRIIVLILASDVDSFAPMLRHITTKIEELLTATASSSPSSMTRTDVYMLIRALVLKISSVHLSPLWPMVDAELRSVFSAVLGAEEKTYSASAGLQAAKMLDLLLLLKPDEFQLHEWLYITDTVDAVYPPNGWTSAALIDRVAQEKSQMLEGEASSLETSKSRKPWLCSEVTRTTAVENIDSSLLLPFFSQLSIHAFEDVYGLRQIDVEACEHDLLADVFEI